MYGRRSKQRTHTFDIQRSGLKKCNGIESKEQYRVEISGRFAALKNLCAEADTVRTWETIRETINHAVKESVGYNEFKHEPWFEEGCSEVIDQRKQAKLQ